MTNTTLKRRIKNAISRKQSSVREVSEITGISKRTLERRMTSPMDLTIGELEKICEALKVSTEQILRSE